MGRRKLARIRDLGIAQGRLAGLRSIDPGLDFGNGISTDRLDAIINTINNTVSRYNGILSEADELYNSYRASLTELRELSNRLLTGVGSKYGKNSSQYEMAGGTRLSERKKRVGKKAG